MENSLKLKPIQILLKVSPDIRILLNDAAYAARKPLSHYIVEIAAEKARRDLGR